MMFILINWTENAESSSDCTDSPTHLKVLARAAVVLVTPASLYPGELVLTARRLFFLPVAALSTDPLADATAASAAEEEGLKKWPRRERCLFSILPFSVDKHVIFIYRYPLPCAHPHTST